MSFDILYHELVKKEDIPKLSKRMRERIRGAIEDKLYTHPEIFGKPLRKSRHPYRKLRVGDYRVIFKMEKSIVKVLIIEHRSVVYKHLKLRI
ncbi:MAG: type II toxin-antitoxin system RelE/ParE family toxin [Parcubacteria group bacterium]